MSRYRDLGNWMDGDGVSETIAGVLLIGLTVVGITLISVLIFSQPVAEEVPAVDVIVSNNGSTVYFQHIGGDSLGQEDFTIFVDENAVPASELDIQSPGEWPWSVGEIIMYDAVGPVTPLNEQVRITFWEDGGTLLRPSYVDDAGAGTQLADISSTPLPTLSPGGVPAVINPAEAGEIVAESVLSDSQIIAAFASIDQTAIVEDKYFNFTIESTDSTIVFAEKKSDNFLRNLNQNDKISIRTVADNSAGNRISITGVGQTFFTLRFEKVNVWINGNPVLINSKDEIQVKSAWIPEYSNLVSNLELRLDPTYELYINGTLDSRSGSSTAITLENVRPTDSGMFVINAWSPNDNQNSVLLVKADGV